MRQNDLDAPKTEPLDLGLGDEQYREDEAVPIAPPGCRLIPDHGRELLLDLDTPEAVQHFCRYLGRFIEIMEDEGGSVEWVRIWPSRHNTHAQVRLAWYRSTEWRVAVQAALGSDPVREMLQIERTRNGRRDQCLFKPREEEASWRK